MRSSQPIKAKSRGLQPGMKLFLMTLPLIILHFLFAYLPLEGWRMAFYDYKVGRTYDEMEFVGLKYFTAMFIEPIKRRETLRVLRNTLVMNGIAVATGFLPMVFAVLLRELKVFWLKKMVQTFTTIPNFVSWVVVFSAASNILTKDSGILNILLKELGIIDEGIAFLTTSDGAWAFMWGLDIWKTLGYSAILYLAAISAIDQELYEAAAIDGAGRLGKIRHITIPFLMPMYVTMLIMSIGSCLNSDLGKLFMFQNAFNRTKIETIALYTYNLSLGSIATAQYGLSVAVGLMQTFVGLVLMMFSNNLAKKVRGSGIL